MRKPLQTNTILAKMYSAKAIKSMTFALSGLIKVKTTTAKRAMPKMACDELNPLSHNFVLMASLKTHPISR